MEELHIKIMWLPFLTNILIKIDDSFWQILAVFLIKPPQESDADSMMPLVSPLNDEEIDDESSRFFPSDGRDESSPLVDLNGEGKFDDAFSSFL